MYTHGDGFCGLGAFAYAFQSAGFVTDWMFDHDPYCQAVARRHFPYALHWGDIFDLHYPPYVDVFTAGFPCQPFSESGLRQGAHDQRYLIPEMLRIIQEVAPRAVLLENVSGFTTLDDGVHFRRLLRAIAALGYHAEWGHLRASDFGAPHKRERLLIVAYREGAGLAQRGHRSGQNPGAHPAAPTGGNGPRPYRYRSVICRPQPDRQAQPGMGRDVDGLAAQLVGHQWPRGRGRAQYAYEPARQAAHAPQHNPRLHMLGNAVLPQMIYPLAVAIREWLTKQDEEEQQHETESSDCHRKE